MSCEIVSFDSSKACSGKCRSKSSCHRASPRVWVVAACEGRIALLDKSQANGLAPLPHGEDYVFSTLDEFQKAMAAAEKQHEYDQLVLVGSNSDIAWVHAAFPPSSTHSIAAEIKYPLMPAWFSSQGALQTLTQALGNVVV